MRKKFFPFALLVFLAAISYAFFVLNRPAPPQEAAPVGHHVSMYFSDNETFFTDSIKPFTSTQPLTSAPHIFIVNQHILAASIIAHQFALAADSTVTTVFLLTQNNWEAGQAPIITSQEGWYTPLGTIEPATSAVNDLVQKNLAAVDESIFAHEHGITGIVPYVAHAYPNARIVTLVIRDGTPDSQVDALAAEISKFKDTHTAIVGTIDMSHYLPKVAADMHDRSTLQVIESFDYQSLPLLDIDTAPTLRAVLKVAEASREQKFIKTGGANSADIVSDQTLTSTTSYLSGYFSAGVPLSAATTSLLFVGDIMLDRGVAAHATKDGADSLYKNIERLFLGNDINVANLEGTITDNESIAQKDHSILRFTFDRTLAKEVLSALRVGVVSQANNHAFDFGAGGYAQTHENLGADKVAVFGHPFNTRPYLSTMKQVRGKNICFVGYMELFNSDTTSVLNEIQRIQPDCYRVVVFAHWGVEYQVRQSAMQEREAHEFIDAGADLVIGAHPHVVEPVEIYKGKAIFYSLGNFIFDQDFSFETEHGLAVGVEFSDTQTRFTVVPLSIQHAELSFPSPAEKDAVLNALVDSATAPDIVRAILTESSFTLPN